MLHQEELALRRALYASLFADKSPQKSDSASAGNDEKDEKDLKQDIDQQQASSPRDSTSVHLRPPSPEPSPIVTPQKRMKVSCPSPSYECVSPDFGSGFGSSPAHGMYTSSNPSSPVGSPGSIESSLRLVLSTSSWSSSTSSNWSSEPTSPYTKPRAKKIKRSPIKQKGNTPSQKSPGKGKRRSKITVNYTLFGQASPDTPKKASPKTKLTPEKGSNVTDRVKKPSSNAKISKGKVRMPASGKRNFRVPMKKKREIKQTDSLPEEPDHKPLSSEAAIVLHDHCYSALNKETISAMDISSKATDLAANPDGMSTSQQQSASALW